MKIKDIINIEGFNPVIKLQDSITDNKSDIDNLIKSFVVTEDVERNLILLLDSIHSGHGEGFFLKGHFGSGKSHFLSILNILLSEKMSWNVLSWHQKDNYKSISQKNIITVPIPLMNYSRDISLANIILFHVEECLSKTLNRSIALSDISLMIEQFKKYILPAHPEFYKTIDKKEFDNLCNTDVFEALQPVKQFLASKEGLIPTISVFNRNIFFRQLNDIIKKNNIDGIFIIIDELSEFLKSKSSENFIEDVRFLQLLGEQCDNRNMWVLGALQEFIEETRKDTDLQNTFTRVKDRFRKRLHLSTIHISDIIEKRLMIKSDRRKELLTELYDKYKKMFPDTKVSLTQFVKLYPVSYYTLELLEDVSLLFSQKRGILYFIYSELEKIINHDIDLSNMITPDVIYDHYEDRIRELDNINEYATYLIPYFEKELKQLFSGQRDIEFGKRIIKISVLSLLSRFKKTYTAKQFTIMLNSYITKIDAKLNYIFLEENILSVIEKNCDYFHSSYDEINKEKVYFIRFEKDIKTFIEQRIKEKLSDDSEFGSKQFIKILQYINIPDFNLKEYLESQRLDVTYNIRDWSGEVILSDLCCQNLKFIDSIVNRLSKTKYTNRYEYDWSLILGVPIDTDKQHDTFNSEIKKLSDNRFHNGIIFLKPVELLQAEKDKLKEFIILQNLVKSFEPGMDNYDDIINYTENRIHRIKIEIIDIIKNSYLYSTFYDAAGKIDFIISDEGTLLKVCEKIFVSVLQKIYPNNSAIKTFTKDIKAFEIDHIIKSIFSSRYVTGTIDEMSGNYIETILEPLSLVKRTKKSIKPSISFAEGTVFDAIISFMVPNKKIYIDDIYTYFRKGQYGMHRDIFNLFISILLYTGYLAGYNKEGLYVKFTTSALLSENNMIQYFSSGSLLDEKYLDKVRKLFFFLTDDKIESFNLAAQKLLWRDITDTKKKFDTELDTLQVVLSKSKKSSLSRYINYNIINNPIEHLKTFFGLIKISLDSQHGLQYLLEESTQIDDIEKDYNAFVYYNNFFKNKFHYYANTFLYFNNIHFIEPVSPEIVPLKQEIYNIKDKFKTFFQDSFSADTLADFERTIREIVNEYRKIYMSEHDKYYNSFNKSDIKKIKMSGEYILLEKLSRIKLISIDNDIYSIDRLLDQTQEQCLYNVYDLTDIQPVCNCGYLLQKKAVTVEPAKIVSTIQSGILGYLSTLKEQEFYEKIYSRINVLKDIGKEHEADKIEQILNIKINQTDITDTVNHFDRLINYDIINLINEAFQGTTLVVNRNIDSFVEQIKNKKIVKHKLVTLFNEWVSGKEKTVEDDVFINIVADGGAGNFLNKYHGLEKVIPDEPLETVVFVYWIVVWMNQYQIDDINQHIYRLTGVKTDKIESLIKSNEYRFGSDEQQFLVSVINKKKLWDKIYSILDYSENDYNKLIKILSIETIIERIYYRAIADLIKKVVFESNIDKIRLITEQLNNIDGFYTRYHYSIIIKFVLKLKEINLIKPKIKEFRNIYDNHYVFIDYCIASIESMNSKYELVETSFIDRLLTETNNTKSNINKFYKGLDKNPPGIFDIQDFKKHITVNDKYILFVFDALRYDIFKIYIQPHLKKVTYHTMILKTAVPTDTETNRQYLFENIFKDNTLFNDYDSTTCNITDDKAIDDLKEYLNKTSDKKVVYINFIDKLIHNNPQIGLLQLYETIKSIITNNFVRILSKIDFSDRDVIICTDHGFDYNPDKKTKYTHSKETVFTSLIPFLNLEGKNV